MELDDQTPMTEAVKTNSKYLAKEDVDEDGVTLTIDHFTREVLTSDEKGEQQKTVVHWKEKQKSMVLGKTTMTQLAYATGAKTLGEAKGRQVRVYTDPLVMFGTRVVGGLRIRKAAQAAPQRPSPHSTPDSSIPF